MNTSLNKANPREHFANFFMKHTVIARCALFSTNVSLNAIDLSKYDTMEPDIIIKTKKVDGMIVNSEESDSDSNGDDLPSSQESARLQMGHQMNNKPYVDASFQSNKVGELVAALHTSLSYRALRKYTMGQTFDSLEANGLFIHRSCGVIHMKVTLTKQGPMKITSILLVSGLLTPELFCSPTNLLSNIWFYHSCLMHVAMLPC